MDDIQELSDFVRIYVRSIWSLELILLLSSDHSKYWTVPELVRELRSNKGLVEKNLAFFDKNGLAALQEGAWRFAPANGHISDMVRQLADTYRQRPVYIVGLIARSDPIQQLANAFKLDGGGET